MEAGFNWFHRWFFWPMWVSLAIWQSYKFGYADGVNSRYATKAVHDVGREGGARVSAVTKQAIHGQDVSDREVKGKN